MASTVSFQAMLSIPCNSSNGFNSVYSSIIVPSVVNSMLFKVSVILIVISFISASSHDLCSVYSCNSFNGMYSSFGFIKFLKWV